MNFNDPIDITAVNTAVKAHSKQILAIDHQGADAMLRHMTPMVGITDSYTFTEAFFKTVSSRYTGVFKEQKNIGSFGNRTLTVHPCVIEILDEPERYRRAYIAEVRGQLEVAKHPFEIWLINRILQQASEDLLPCIWSAKLSSSDESTALKDSFNGLGYHIKQGKTEGTIAAGKGNLVSTGKFTRADVGTQLLSMWRHMPELFRNQKSKLYIPYAVGDLYDDWFADEHPNVHQPNQSPDETGQQFLYGSKGKCELVRCPGMPDDSSFAMLTLKENVVYGTDKQSDMRTLRAVPADYMFKALGKYVFGTQFTTFRYEMFCTNDQPVDPADV